MADFDAYLMVDWSASSRPAKGADSVWYCLLNRSAAGLSVSALENPATRSSAVQNIKEILRDLVRQGQQVLVGFDFSYGYPSGFASALGVGGTSDWLAVWLELARAIVDRGDNSNNRFEVAADFNRRISGECYPFWGCPQGSSSSTISSTKGPRGPLAEKRITDVGNMQPIWKLFGNGSVGSQTLLGIPHLTALRNDPELAALSRVWPFETGLRRLPNRDNRNWLILHAEIYPSLLEVHPRPGEVKDAAQVRELAVHFAALDDAGLLADLFGGSPLLTATERQIVEREEGWTLGVGGNAEAQKARKLDSLHAAPSKAVPRAAARPPGKVASRTTQPGYENRNRQVVVRSTGSAGTDHGQYVYVLRCGECGHEYGANASDIFQRRCPLCQRGRPGL